MNRGIKGLILVISTAVFLSGCTSGEERAGEKQTKFEEGVVRQNSTGDDAIDGKSKTKPLEDDPTVVFLDPLYASRDNLKPMGETVEYNGIEYTVTDVKFSKELGEHDPSQINYFDEERDEDGTLTGPQSYVFLELTIKNVSDKEREELVNHSFVLVKEDNQIQETGTACRGVDDPQEGHTMENAHHFILKPQESAKTGLVYIIEDEYLTDELYFLVGNGGSEADRATNRFIHVGSEVGR